MHQLEYIDRCPLVIPPPPSGIYTHAASIRVAQILRLTTKNLIATTCKLITSILDTRFVYSPFS